MDTTEAINKMKSAFDKLGVVTENATPEQKKQMKDVFGKMDKFNDGSSDGANRGIAYFENLQKELIKKSE